MLMVAGPSSNKRLIQMMPLLRPPAGMAEVVKGAGLKIRSRMGSWVRIPPPALLSNLFFPLVEGALSEQTMQNRLTVG